jgi:hypothetical protein
MSELGISRTGTDLGADATAAILRHVRAATEAEFAALGAEHSRVDVFRASNEVAGALLTDLRSQSPTDEALERFLQVILYATHQAEIIRRERECFPPPEAPHVSVTSALGLHLVDAQRGILIGASIVEELFPASKPDNPGTIGWQLLHDHVSGVWPRHLANLEGANA